jgi:Helix-turn-helix domain
VSTQNARVLAFIRSHPGCTTMELIYGLQPHVSNPRARISDLRAAGHRIVATRGRYHLVVAPAQLSIDGSERLLA